MHVGEVPSTGGTSEYFMLFLRIFVYKIAVLCSCHSAYLYSLRFFEMISAFNLSRNTGFGGMFSRHFSFPLEKFCDSLFVNP